MVNMLNLMFFTVMIDQLLCVPITNYVLLLNKGATPKAITYINYFRSNSGREMNVFMLKRIMFVLP